MKYKLQDRVITTKIIADVKGELRIIDKDVEGMIIGIDETAKTTQPYLVEFKETNIKGCGNRWWVFEEEIARY